MLLQPYVKQKNLMHWFVIKLKKLILDHFLSKNLCKFFPQKSHLSQILSSYGAVTSLKKSEKFHILIFHKTWKTSFWTLLAQKPCNKIFFDKLSLVTF